MHYLKKMFKLRDGIYGRLLSKHSQRMNFTSSESFDFLIWPFRRNSRHFRKVRWQQSLRPRSPIACSGPEKEISIETNGYQERT